jgi:hypothetical protein
MTQSAATKLLIARMLNETVEIADHDRESFRLRKLENNIWNFVGFDSEHTLGRPTIIAHINALHCNSPIIWGTRHSTERSATRSPKVVMTTDTLPVSCRATAKASIKAMGCPAATLSGLDPFVPLAALS